MTHIDESTREALEKIIVEDLKHAEVVLASVSIIDNGRIVVDEIIFRLVDGRQMSVDVGDAATTVVHVTYHTPALILESFGATSGWRPATVEQDYADDLADLTTADRPEVDEDE